MRSRSHLMKPDLIDLATNPLVSSLFDWIDIDNSEKQYIKIQGIRVMDNNICRITENS